MQELASADAAAMARVAGLRYVTDRMPGIRRECHGGEVRYIDVDGRSMITADELARIKALGIPPAWTDVWICPRPNGHLQATGRDAKGRKQYRYHPRWREVRDETKYHRMIAFGEALPEIRARVQHDLGLRGLPREKALATIVQLLDETAIRVGNEAYARENQSYGLTTLEARHVAVAGETLHLHFTGKAGKEHRLTIRDRRVARIVKRMVDLPVQELFQYLDEQGLPRTIESNDVNQYIQEIAGGDFTAKDFRTWHGTICAVQTLSQLLSFTSETEAKRHITQAIKAAAEHLGNTPAICRKAYIHPAMLDAYLDGSLEQVLAEHATSPSGLGVEEAAVLALLQREAGGQATKVEGTRAA